MNIGFFEILPLLILIAVIGLIFFIVKRYKNKDNKAE